jgi:hypothetical protein
MRSVQRRQLADQPLQDDLEARIERAHQRLLAARTLQAQRVAWTEMRRLILERPQNRVLRDGRDPEPARAVIDRILFRLLVAWETRRPAA